MSGMIGDVFGTRPTQYGTAQSGGQAWMESLLKPGLVQLRDNYYSGQQGFATPEMPQLPGYGQTPQSPYTSPMDMIQSGEMRTAQNLREQFYSGGSGGSAMGGVSGQGSIFDSNLASELAKGAVSRYGQMQLPYDQMLASQQANMFSAGVGQQQQQYQTQAAAMDPTWLYGMYSGTYGSPMVGERGIFSRLFGTQTGYR